MWVRVTCGLIIPAKGKRRYKALNSGTKNVKPCGALIIICIVQKCATECKHRAVNNNSSSSSSSGSSGSSSSCCCSDGVLERLLAESRARTTNKQEANTGRLHGVGGGGGCMSYTEISQRTQPTIHRTLRKQAQTHDTRNTRNTDTPLYIFSLILSRYKTYAN